MQRLETLPFELDHEGLVASPGWYARVCPRKKKYGKKKLIDFISEEYGYSGRLGEEELGFEACFLLSLSVLQKGRGAPYKVTR